MLWKSDHRAIELSEKCNHTISTFNDGSSTEIQQHCTTWMPVRYECLLHCEDLFKLDSVLNDEISANFKPNTWTKWFIIPTPIVAIRCFKVYVTQSCQQAFDNQRVEPYRSRGTVWFDSDYKRVPCDAVESGGPGMYGSCRNYRNPKQQKAPF